jgi:hypothetical protein
MDNALMPTLTLAHNIAASSPIPDFGAEVACPPSCTGTDNPPKYAPLRVGDFMLHSNATDWNKDLRHG